MPPTKETHPIGRAIEQQRNRERAARECLAVFLKNSNHERTQAIIWLRKILESEEYYGD